MNLFFTLFLIAGAALALFFFAKFTRYGTIDFKTAWNSFTLWLAAIMAVLGQFAGDLLGWLASLWEPLQAQAGDLFANPSFGQFVSFIGVVFFLVRSKGQGFPKLPDFPSIPDETDDAGA